MKSLMLLSLFLFILSCGKVNCVEYTKMLSKEECIIVVEIPPTSSVWFEVKGYDPATQIPKICKTNNRWWNLYWNEIEVGDTIVKKKGELTFNIHKKDSIITHFWKCYEE
ncbi:hypothetical protein [Chryseobacterium flavum]|uniref:hypothetical protein n=1 Tax=Chryseobacterium flavum TaxID=415851 RepID=UPI0028AF3965|nr:hypothetical protein [Chryseobacterium flavum]